MTPKEVLTLIREKEVKAIDLRFIDLPGTWQHFTIPPHHLEESTFQDGLGFDGSSIRGWQAINESDMLVIPQADTAFIDPFFKETTLVLICSIQDPLTRQDYSRDPRFIARKAVNYMKASGIADTAFFGPELEFFVFDNAGSASRSGTNTPATISSIAPKERGTPAAKSAAAISATRSATRKATSPSRRAIRCKTYAPK